MNNLLRFTGIFGVIAVAIVLVLGVGGMLTSDEIWDNLVKIGSLIGILFGASLLILLLSKSK